MTQTTAVLLMFAITTLTVSALFVPAIAFQRRSKLVNFYWVGVWMFLGLIAAISGAEQTLYIAGIDAAAFSLSLQTAAVTCFVIFVMFAWLRLSGAALLTIGRKLTRYRGRAPAKPLS